MDISKVGKIDFNLIFYGKHKKWKRRNVIFAKRK